MRGGEDGGVFLLTRPTGGGVSVGKPQVAAAVGLPPGPPPLPQQQVQITEFIYVKEKFKNPEEKKKSIFHFHWAIANLLHS